MCLKNIHILNQIKIDMDKKIKLDRDNLQAFCRTCLQLLGSKTTAAPKYSMWETPHLMKMFILCTAIDMYEESDNIYPQLLCTKCYQTLQEFQLFREMALQSNEMLEKIIQNEDGVLNAYHTGSSLQEKDTSCYKSASNKPTNDELINDFKAEDPEMKSSYYLYDVNDGDDPHGISADDETTASDIRNDDGVYEEASTSSSAMKRKRKMGSNDIEMQTKKRKISISNKEQIRLIVETMKLNPEMARGQQAFGQLKQAYEDVWLQLSEELNKIGPPVRKRQVWQRVWTNYKQTLRRKINNNLQNVQAEVPLTELEITVAELLDIRTDVSPAEQTCSENLMEPFPNEENLATPPSPTPLSPPPNITRIRLSKRRKAIERRRKNQLLIIKKLEGIRKCCYRNYKANKEILDIKKQKFSLLKNIEKEEAILRKLDIELKENKLLLKFKKENV